MRTISGLIITIVAAFGIAFYFYNESSAQLAAREKNAERAITNLPPGVEGMWLEYVDRRTRTLVRESQGALLLNSFRDETVAVSQNTPYKITCNSYSGQINFGYGENSVLVPIYGLVLDDLGDPAPALGVSKFSRAAEKLSAVLCERIAGVITQIVQSSNRS